MICDASVLYALADRDDAGHRKARSLFASSPVRIVPEPVVVEADALIAARLGAAPRAAFLRALADGSLPVASSTGADRRRASEIAAASPEIGYAGAVVVAFAERMRDPVVATFEPARFTGAASTVPLIFVP